MHYEWLALAAALLWAIASLLSVLPASHLGAFAFNRWRMGCVTLMLAAMSLVTGGFASLSPLQMASMALSGLIGIFIGDTALYACLNRLGPRRAGLLFACHAVFTALFGLYLFGEQLQGGRLLGAVLVMAGVMVAVLYARGGGSLALEITRGPLAVGLALGLLAAVCQSLGTLIAKPIMTTGADPVAGSCVRMATALLAHLALRLSGVGLARARQPLNGRVLGIIALNGFLAMGLGMTFIMLALRLGSVSMVAILSSTTPVMLLPLLWWHTGQRPGLPAWLGGVLVVAGTALVLSR